MDGFGSRWTPGGLIGAVHLTAGRSSVVPNDGRARAWAATGRGHARPATPPVSRRVRDPNIARRCCARANDVRASVRATPTVRGEMGSSAGDERAPRSRSNRAGRFPHRATREWEGHEGAGAQVAEGDQSAQGGTRLYCTARRPERRPGPSCVGSETGFGAIRPRPVAANWVSVQFRRSRWQRNGFRCSDLKAKSAHCSK